MGVRTLLSRLESCLRGRTEEDHQVASLQKQLAAKDRQIVRLRRELIHKDFGETAGGVKPENIVWIFGAPRTGSTWLSRMMGEIEGHTVWREPLVGALFGNLYYIRAPHRRGRNFVLGGKREAWLPAVRVFVLQTTRLRHPDVEGDGYLIIKEPNGSIGSPLLMEALPESRMVLLIRDPRDVVASILDASRENAFRARNLSRKLGKKQPISPPDIVVEASSNDVLQHMGNAKQAYDAHKGRKVLVRYEELRADTLGTMKRIYSALEIPVDEGKLSQAVEKYSWENIPEEEKGEGKFFRKATPGGWSEDLTPRQVKIVERITAPLLQEFYPA
jgi:sulfotransferase family protein